MTEFSLYILPQNIEVKVKEGKTLLEAIISAGITINNLCGEQGICNRCKVIVKQGKVNCNIKSNLTHQEIIKGYVLACHSYIETDVVIEIPGETLAREKTKDNKDAARFIDIEKKEIIETNKESLPLIQKVYLELQKPTFTNNISDQQNICDGLHEKLKQLNVRMGLDVLKHISDVLRRDDYKVTATIGLRKDFVEIINIEGKNTERNNHLIVVDIGTTTVMAYLINVCSFQTINAKASFNSQGIYGREVTSRIISAEKHGHEKLQTLLISDLNILITELVKESYLNQNDINAIVCVGNTVMIHFLLGLTTCSIRRDPCVAVTNEPPILYAKEVGIKIHPLGLLYPIQGIGAWVGSDITAGILACGIYKTNEISLVIDIGTNGEVVVGNKDWLIATSASAGPALEGASVECGMRAEEGAIERIFTDNGRLCYNTIGDAMAVGLCGSGIIDFIAELLNENIIDRSGKFIDNKSDQIKKVNGIKRFTLKDNNMIKPIYLTENDIENVIIAKAAIYSAVKILLKRFSLSLSDILHLYICGAFGNHINMENAISIGLIPNIDPDRIEFMGNTAIKGAKMLALDQNNLETLKYIKKITIYYDLIGAEDYVDEFKKAMFLPHTDVEEFIR